jgi:hypothetical protein
MRLKVDGAWGRYDCIVNAPYSEGRAVHGRGKAIC